MQSTTQAPVARPRRGRLLVIAAIAVLALALLASCSREPTAYSGGIRKNFVKGCTGHPTPANDTLSAKVCGCVYDKLEKSVEFKDFKSLQDDLRSKHKPLDQLGPVGKKAVSYLTTCQKSA